MAALLAIMALALYGGADFLGGLASRRTGALTAAAVSQLFGVLALIACVALGPVAHPSRDDLLWGAATGLFGAFALGLFYQALATGRMSVVAPVAAATGDAVAVMIGLAIGERPSLIVLLGFALALASIVLVGQEGQSGARLGRGVAAAVGSGLAIGAFYACLHCVSIGAGLWPLVAARAISLPLLLAANRASGRSIAVPRDALPLIVPCGLIDIAANVCYLIAVRNGMLSIVATLASLYPAVTVVLAWWVLRERLRAPQYLGLGVGAVATVLISLG